MTYTQMCGLDEQGRLVQDFVFQNAWKGAMHVWRMVQATHLPALSMFEDADLQQIWNIGKEPGRPDWLRITMLSTFDDVLVRRRELGRVAGAFRAFAAYYGPGSLLEQADALEKLALLPEVHAVGWCQTSVIENPWTPFDPEAGASRPFDFAGDPHWFLFDEYPQLASPVPA